MKNSDSQHQKIIKAFKVSRNELKIVEEIPIPQHSKTITILSQQTNDSVKSTRSNNENKKDKNLQRFKIFLDFLDNPKNGGSDYYKQFCSVYIANKILLEKIANLLKEKDGINNNLSRLEESSTSLLSKRRPEFDKRPRSRTREEIVKDVKCKDRGCGKLYGSKSAMILHMRRKHGFK